MSVPARNLVVILIGLTLFTCSRSPRCWGEDKNKGFIESSAQIECLPDSDKKEFRIDSDSALKSCFNSGCELPVIDFSKHTLLGLYASGGCELKFIRLVKRSGTTYTYSVKVNQCGACKKLSFSYNWVIVPKLTTTDKVIFELK